MTNELHGAILIAFGAAGFVVFIVRDLSIPFGLPRGRKQVVNFLFGCVWISVVIAIICLIAVQSSIPDSPVRIFLSDFLAR